ncbi:MAG TPA: CpsB/CapC family capsule biosynthesis tyrosine phosphatase [Gaiellaceae bacterium]|nr:CpsB/CapC family capsule biosynthesis tyrosine phosphatase [Gaiellaceae bacterium]
MIDTHCHLLPKLDDGPANDDAAVGLAVRLVETGVSIVLCTPHYSSMFPTDRGDALSRESALVRTLEAAGVGLELALAAEVSPERAVAAPDEELLGRCIAGSYLLVELLPDTPMVTLATICERLSTLDLLPIFAHPERCRALARSLDALDDARRQGALVQVVARSLLGRWGADIQTLAWRLVDTGRADLLASDAHHRRHGGALLQAATLVGDRLGDGVRNELTVRRPGLVLSGVHPETRSRL